MGYQAGNNEWVDSVDLTLAGSAARTASGNGAAADVAARRTLSVLLDVTAAAGTSPTLNVTVETSHTGTSGWRSMGSFVQAIAVSSERKSFGGADRHVRVVWTLGGTSPSFTFSVAAEAV